MTLGTRVEVFETLGIALKLEPSECACSITFGGLPRVLGEPWGALSESGGFVVGSLCRSTCIEFFAHWRATASETVNCIEDEILEPVRDLLLQRHFPGMPSSNGIQVDVCASQALVFHTANERFVVISCPSIADDSWWHSYLTARNATPRFVQDELTRRHLLGMLPLTCNNRDFMLILREDDQHALRLGLLAVSDCASSSFSNYSLVRDT